jgi:hypothetical protein
MPLALHHSLSRLLIGAVLVCPALAAAGCGSDDPDPSGSPGGGVTFAESKQGVIDLVDETYEAVLSDLEPRRFPENAIPCREGGGAGGATGDYVPNGALEFDVPEGEKAKRLVKQVRDYWEEQGYQGIQMVPSGEAVFAQTDDYRLSFEITPTQARGKLGAGGPCATPKSEEERDAPLEFRSLKGD